MIAILEPKSARANGETDSSQRFAELGTTISASRLSVWLQCTLKFHFRYLLANPQATHPFHAFRLNSACGAAALEHDPLATRAFALAPFNRLFAVQWTKLQPGA